MKEKSLAQPSNNLKVFVSCLLAFSILITPIAAVAGKRAPMVTSRKPATSNQSSQAVAKNVFANPPAPVTAPLPVGPVSATMTATITTDADSDAKADPSPADVITYSTTFTNNSGGDLSGLQFTDTVDPHTTIISGSAVAAGDDAYSTIGNVNVVTNAAQGVLTNDFNPNTGNNTGMTVSSYGASTGLEQTSVGSSTPTAQGGTITIQSDGSFTFDPKVGFTGTDTFKYAANQGGRTAIATVRITISNMIWFVKNDATACTVISTPCGTLAHPFSTLAAFQAVNDAGVGPPQHPKTNDVIFIYTGVGNYTGGVTLLNGQKLVGQGATASIETITGFSTPSGQTVLPTTSGSNPVFTTGSLTDNIRLGTGNSNLLRGFTVGDSGTAATGDSADISGTNIGTLTVSEVTLNGSGRTLNINGGALSGSFTSVSSNKSSGQGLTLTGVTGSINMGSTTISNFATGCISVSTTTANVNFGNTSCTLGGSDGVNLTNNSAGTRTFGTLNVSGITATAFIHASGGGDVNITGAATMSTAGNVISVSAPASGDLIDFQAATSATTSGSQVTGINWAGASGAAMQFNSLSIQRNSSIALNATTGGTITVTNGTGSINNTTDGGPAIVAANIALNANFSAINSSASAPTGTSAVSLTNVTGTSNFGTGALSGATGATFLVSGGTESVTYNGTIGQANANPAVSIAGHATGTFTFGGNITASVDGADLFFDNADGTYNFNATNAFTNGAGINITNGSGGTFSFSGNTSVTNGLVGANNACFVANGSTAGVTYSGNLTKSGTSAGLLVDITNEASGTITFQTGTLSSTSSNGTGINLNNADGTVNFNGTNTLNGGNSHVDINTGCAGTFSFSSSTTITSPSGAAYNEDTSTASVTYNGTITQNNAQNAVNINAKTGGTTLFQKATGGQITASTATANAIDLTNTGGTVTFTGGLSLTTTSGVGFNASASGATINATQDNSTIVNTISSTTGTALNVANTTIGASNLTFRSITAGTAASGPTNGIILNSTGASGGLIVTGTGSVGTGGTIQKTGGSGISLTSVGGSASFTDLNISNTAGDGITAATVHNFSCSLVNITNPGSSANKDGIRMTDASGAASLTNVTVTGASTDGINITNSSATLTSLTITGGSLSSTNNAFASADSGLIVIAKTTGVITAASVTGVTFNANFSSAIQSFAQDTAQIGDITVSGCTFTNNGAAAADFDAGTGSNPQMKFHFLNNLTITGNKGPVVNVFSSSTATGGLIQGRIDGNHIGTAGVADSGSTGGAGIRVFLQGVAGNITIVNNVIRSTACSRGIDVQTLGPVPANGGVRQSDIVITGNDVNNSSSDCAFPLNDIYLTSDNQAGGAGTTLHAEVHNNTIKTAGASPANTDFPFDNLEWLYFDHTAGTAQLVDFNGPHANANAAIAATQTSGSAKANAAVTLIPGPITTVAINTLAAPKPLFENAGLDRGNQDNVSNLLVSFLDTNSAAPSILESLNRATSAIAVSRSSAEAQPSLVATATGVGAENNGYNKGASLTQMFGHVTSWLVRFAGSVDSLIEPTAYAEAKPEVSSPKSEVTTKTSVVRSQRSDVRLNHARNSALVARNSKLSTTITPFAACSPAGINGGGTAICVDIPTIHNGDSITISFQVTVNNPPNLSGVPPGTPQVTNFGTVTGGFAGSPLNTNTVNTPVDRFDSTTTLGSSLNPANQGDSITFTATVAISGSQSPTPPAPLTPTGTVTFKSDSVAIAGCSNVALNGSAQAQCVTSALTPPSHNITVDYSGDGNYDPSTSNTVSQTIIACGSNPVVTNTLDSGAGSLRDAITNICSSPNNNVTFNIPAGDPNHSLGVYTITLSTGQIPIAKNINITGPNSVTNTDPIVISGNNAGRVFKVNSGITAVIDTLTMTNGLVSGASPGGNGGAIYNDHGTLTIKNSTVSGSTANPGGGIFNDGSVSGSATLNILNSTVSGNTSNADGGAIHNQGVSGGSATLNITNSTISGNLAKFSGGGAVSDGTSGSASVTITNSTITNNRSDSDTNTVGDGGGLAILGGSSVILRNSIVALNFKGGSPSTTASDVFGALDAANSTHNDVGDCNSCGLTNGVSNNTLGVTGAQLNLGTLGNNGGPVQTHALLAGSIAIEAGNNAYVVAPPFLNTSPITDERGVGFPRLADSADADTTATVDIGAYEAHPTVEDITDKSTAEDTPFNFNFNIGDGTGALITSVTATSGNTTLIPNANVSVTGSGPTRNLAITPATNANTPSDGTSTITVTVTATNGRTATDTFVVTVAEVNDAPTANNDTVPDILEDSGTYSIPIASLLANDSKGPANESGQTLSVTGVSNFTGGTAVVNGSNIDFTPTANYFGAAGFDYTIQDNGTTNGSADPKQSTGHVSFNITAVNDAPSFTKGADQTVNEDAGAQSVSNWATNISPGPANESGQTVSFNIIGNTNSGLFSVQPAVSSSGTLTYTPAANAFGTATMTLTAQDNGGVLNGGQDTSPSQSFTITVNAVADTPTVTPNPASTNEDTQTSGLVVSRNAVDGAEVTHFKITNIQHGTLFQNNGTTQINAGDFITFAQGNAGLKFTPATDYNNAIAGAAGFDVQASTQSSNTGLGGAVVTEVINVTAVNDAPSFTKGPDQNALINSGAQTVNGWATNIAKGPATATDETGQTVNFIATNNNNGLFSSQPAVSASGDLTYTPATNQSGSATVSVSLHDNGGGVAPNVDTSAVQTFTISVGCGASNVVKNTNDSGADSLRNAILTACVGDTVTFSNTTAGGATNFFDGSPHQINLTTGELAIGKNLTITGPGANLLTINGSSPNRVFNISSGTVTISKLKISGGTVTGANNGGGLLNAGTLTLINTTVSGNTAANQGGGIYDGGALTVVNTTVSGNTGTLAGGGVYSTGAVTLLNTTISGNNSNGSGGGFNFNGTTLASTNATIANNRSDNDNSGAEQGGGIFRSAGTVMLKNTIVAGNFRGTGSTRDDVSGLLDATGSFNLIGDGTNLTGIANGTNNNQVGSGGSPINALLGTLGSNGGASQTQLLLPGSPAISAGSNALLPTDAFDLDGDSNTGETLPVDQRGPTFNRVVNTTVDLGAVEVNYSITATAGTPQSAVINTAFATALQATVKESGNNQANITVTFTPPASGASGLFTGGNPANANTNGSGVATAPAFTANGTTGGPYNVVVSLAGNLATANFALTNTLANQTITVNTHAPASATYNTQFTVAATASSGLPVSYSSSGSCTNVGATFTITSGTGTCTVKYDQAGNSNYNAAPQVTETVNAQKATSNTAVSAAPNPSNLGQSVTFTATVTGTTTPTGTVQFKDGGTNLGAPATLNGSGVAQLSTSALTAGTHTITADYSSDTNFLTSTGTLTGGQVVNNRPLVSFSAATYPVNEADGFVHVVVNRTGDTTVAFNIDYATDDTGASTNCGALNAGLASQKCDYDTFLGTLKFAANQTQAFIDIPINQDSYTEGPESFTVNLSNPTGTAALTVPSSATVTINDSAPPAGTTNAIDDNTVFVRQHYHDFLNREPDAPGLAFWVNGLNACNDPAQRPPGQTQVQCLEVRRVLTSAAFFLSIEFMQTGTFVRSFYVAALNRPLPPSANATDNLPSFTEWLRDTQAVQRGVVVGQGSWQTMLDANRLAFMQDFVMRAEFVGLYPTTDTPTQYVDKLFLHAGITPSAAERNAAIAEFGSATTAADPTARGRALLDVTQNATFRNREFPRTFVQMEYFGYLRRNPNDPPDGNFNGYNFWLNKLTAFNNDFFAAEMVKAFLSSTEYRNRFGQ